MKQLFRTARHRLAASEQFDPDWYLQEYPDVAQSGVEPARHFLRYGHRMGRDPNPQFSTDFIRTVFHLAPEQEPVSALRDRLSTGAAPDPALILMAAARVAEGGRDRLAVSLAETWLPPHLAHSANLLRANAALKTGNREGWLENLNAYLAAQDVAPITLNAEAALFDRLATRPLPRIAEGPLVSVLMAAWNAGTTIGMAVRSVLDQTWRNLELLVVDDGSTDDTWQVLQRMAAADDRLRIFRNQVNGGAYLSRNIALSQARGQWITGHDADDWAHPLRIESQVGFCRASDLPACLSGMLRIDADGEFVRFNPIGGNVIDGACRNAFISLMVDAQLLHGALGNWDEVRVGGDSELLHRLQAVTAKPVRTLPRVTMLCLDNPAGLTNHAQLGHSESGSVSPHRRAYKKAFTRFHRQIAPTDARLEFPATARRFPAAAELLNAAQTATALAQSYAARGLRLKRRIRADVAIVTNLAFRGGNTTSTLEEIAFFRARGLEVALIHCPTLRDVNKAISPRCDGVGHLVTSWTRLEDLHARVLIVRHPVVVTSPAFRQIAGRLHADHAFVVKNNSRLLADGRPAYDMAQMIAVARQIDTPDLRFCPISGTMRNELTDHDPTLALSAANWLPTLDQTLYMAEPKAAMGPVFRIGRHGRDGVEKWPEDRLTLQLALPEAADFQIVILGGARNALKVLGFRPANWSVLKFGEIEPSDYLRNLDAFVYFPHAGLIEAFGRSIAEAMLAGVPCILPAQFRAGFGDLALYCDPAQVADLVRLLSHDDRGRTAFLREVQRVVRQNHAPANIASRMAGTGLLADATPSFAARLSPEAVAWRGSLLARLQSF